MFTVYKMPPKRVRIDFFLVIWYNPQWGYNPQWIEGCRSPQPTHRHLDPASPASVSPPEIILFQLRRRLTWAGGCRCRRLAASAPANRDLWKRMRWIIDSSSSPASCDEAMMMIARHLWLTAAAAAAAGSHSMMLLSVAATEISGLDIDGRCWIMPVRRVFAEAVVGLNVNCILNEFLQLNYPELVSLDITCDNYSLYSVSLSPQKSF